MSLSEIGLLQSVPGMQGVPPMVWPDRYFAGPAKETAQAIFSLYSGNPALQGAGIRFELSPTFDGFKAHDVWENLAGVSVENQVTSLPGGGGVVRHQRLQETTVAIEVSVVSRSAQRLKQYVSWLHEVVNPGGRAVASVWNPHTQEASFAEWFYVEGLGTPVYANPAMERYRLEFDMMSPFWWGPTRSASKRVMPPSKKFLTASEGSETVGPYTFPFFPVTISESTISSDQGRFDLNIMSQIPVEPVWTIQGPGTDVTLVGPGGEEIFVQGDIGAGETITIDAREGYETVRDKDGPIWGRVPVGRDNLFHLQPGQQTVQVRMFNASPASNVTLEYREARMSPWSVDTTPVKQQVMGVERV